jgi:hypothetical protein
MLEVSGPLCVTIQRANPAVPELSHRPLRAGVDHSTGTDGWSARFAPTAGLSTIT